MQLRVGNTNHSPAQATNGVYNISSVLHREHTGAIPGFPNYRFARRYSKIASQFCTVSVWSELSTYVKRVIKAVHAFTMLHHMSYIFKCSTSASLKGKVTVH